MLSVVLWKWRPVGGDDSIEYTSDGVNHLANQIRKFIGVPHKIFCITDDSTGLNDKIQPLDLDKFPCPMPRFNAYSNRLYKCYRRLKLFDPAIERYFGKRILQLDVDMVITGDLSGIVTRTEEFLCWKCISWGPLEHALNPSFLLMDVGGETATQIWKDYCYHPDKVARDAYSARWTGTEQAVMGYLTRGKNLPTLGTQDGIYSIRDNPEQCGRKGLAPGVKVVSFHGPYSPSDPKLQSKCAWLARAWKESG